MKFFEIIKNVVFYGDTEDKSAIYAEFYTHGGTFKRFTHVEHDVFQAYLRQRISDMNVKKLTASQVTEYIKDYYTVSAVPHRVTPYLRTAGSISCRAGETPRIEYSLGNDTQACVVIDPTGWQITDNPTFKFLSLAQILAQVTPVKSNYSLMDLLAKYVNLRGDMLKIFTIWLIQSFSLCNHHALIVAADRGSGKSFLSRFTRKLVDPSSQDIMAYPDRFDGLQAALGNSYLAIFDNLSDISSKESDLMCTSVTGGTITKRSLYTNNEMFSQKIHNTLLLNGVCCFPEQSDLAERCLLIKMTKLDENTIKTESELWDNFEKEQPIIMGLIFDTLAEAMRIATDLKAEKLPRMADAYFEMLATALALGISQEEFHELYQKNVTALEKERANTPLVEAVREFMNSPYVKGRKASGTVSQLYQQIKANYSGEKKDLPKSPSRFSQSLKAERKTLETVGLDINFDDTFSDGTHLDIIKSKKKN